MVFIWKWLFKMAGWQVEGGLPEDVKKCIVVAAPHTSNWDFFYARAAAYIFNIKVNYLIKNDWLIFPLSIFFKRTGAIGVERKRKNNGLVDSLVQKINAAEELAIIISPEGTRKSVKKWKTGFYHLALQANLPIALAYLDYSRKVAGIGPIIYPTGDYQQDMLKIQEFYRKITPKYPETYEVNIIENMEINNKLVSEV